eukprot:1726762-Pleurochrysis_carterae.AAC.1
MKWNGETFVSLCKGTRGSSGGPRVFAHTVMIMATDLTANSQAHRTGWKDDVQQATTSARGGGGGSGRGGR